MEPDEETYEDDEIYEDEPEEERPIGGMPYNFLLGKYVPADEFFYD